MRWSSKSDNIVNGTLYCPSSKARRVLQRWNNAGRRDWWLYLIRFVFLVSSQRPSCPSSFMDTTETNCSSSWLFLFLHFFHPYNFRKLHFPQWAGRMSHSLEIWSFQFEADLIYFRPDLLSFPKKYGQHFVRTVLGALISPWLHFRNKNQNYSQQSLGNPNFWKEIP